MLNKCVRIHQLRQQPIQIRRFITANQAAAALRPFYFLVHPDKFTRVPDIARNNEKALQASRPHYIKVFVQLVF